MPPPPSSGLIHTGGGARPGCQVDVRMALAQIRREVSPDDRSNPFPVITGTSAGAINAAALASHCDDFDAAVAASNTSPLTNRRRAWRTPIAAIT